MCICFGGCLPATQGLFMGRPGNSAPVGRGVKRKEPRMKLLKIVGIVVIALGVIVVGVGLILPRQYEVSRTITVKAPVSTVHQHVADLDRWEAWQPWTEQDPTIKVRRSEQTTGVGAHQSWTGESGGGELTFTESSEDTGVRYDLVFDDAYKSTGAIQHEAVGNGTRVTWTMAGDGGLNPIDRWFGLMMDSMVGPMFERGLEKLKDAAETDSDGPV